MKNSILKIKNLTCSRGGRLLINDLSFEVVEGQILQVLGDNGAGKTTLLRIITGIYTIYDGSVVWRDDSLDFIYMGHLLGIKNELTVVENIEFSFRVNKPGQNKIKEVLRQLKLDGLANALAGNISQGQRQRIALAIVLLSNAQVWILDEPFAALDIMGVAEIQNILQRKIAVGGTVILTTHRPLTLSILPVVTLSLNDACLSEGKEACI